MSARCVPVVATILFTLLGHAPADDLQLNAAFAQITSAELRRDLWILASDSYGGRGAGYAGERRAAIYAAQSFADSRLRPMGDAAGAGRSYLQKFKFYPRHPPVPDLILSSQNVLGLLPGSDPAMGREVVVIGAHHDGQGRTGEADGGRNAARPGLAPHSIWNSADDNASGMVAVLAIARAIDRSGLKTRRAILFSTFGAEEHGLLGSLYYVAHPALPWRDHVAMLTFEQLGREPQRDPIVMGAGTSSAWTEVIPWANQHTGLQVSVLTPQLIQDTDHYGFGARGVPALAMGIEVSPDAHRPSDTADKIDFERLAARARYGLAVLVWLADRTERPLFAGLPSCDTTPVDSYLAERCSSSADPGMAVTVLTRAEHAAAHVPANTGALKVQAVVAELAADRAGLKPGDLILAVNERRLERDISSASLHAALVAASDHEVALRIKRGRAYREVLLGSLPSDTSTRRGK